MSVKRHSFRMSVSKNEEEAEMKKEGKLVLMVVDQFWPVPY